MFEVGQVVRCLIDHRVTTIQEVIKPGVYRLAFNPELDERTGSGTIRKEDKIEACESGLYNVAYEYEDEQRLYNAQPCDYIQAVMSLANFRRRYFDASGQPKAYPNGQGFYPIRNPRIVEV